MNTVTCDGCGHTWTPRVRRPKVCIECHRRMSVVANIKMTTCVHCSHAWASRTAKPKKCVNCQKDPLLVVGAGRKRGRYDDRRSR